MPESLRDTDPLEHVIQTFDSIKRWREPYEDRWSEFYKIYRSYKDFSATPFKSNLYIPYVFSIIESVVPKMLGTIFNTRPLISVISRKGGTEGLAQLLERLLEYQLDEDQLEFFTKILEFFKEAVIYGTSFAKIIPRFNDDDFATFNYIDVEPVDLFNIYPDYRAKSIRRMKHIIQLSYMDYDELETMANQKFYKGVPELLGYLEGAGTVDSFKRERLTDVGILDEYGFDSNRKIVEVLEYWDKDKVITVGGRKVILKEEANPFNGLVPFIMARYIPVQHELFGIGIPEISESLQDELNTVRNQRMDNVNLIINRMFVANKYADIDFDNLVSYPGNVILTNDVNAIKDLDTRDITKSAYMEEEIIKRDIDNATGEWEYSRGATPPRRETATGIVRLQQASNVRFDTVVKLLEFTVIRAIAKVFLWLDYNFLPKEDFATIVGEEDYLKYGGELFYQIPVDQMLKQYHFQPMGSSTTAIKEVRVQQAMQAFKLFNGDPFLNQKNLRKMVLDSLDIRNISSLLLEQPIPPQIQAGMAPPGMPGQPGQGGPPQGGGGPEPPKPPEPGAGPISPEGQVEEMGQVQGGGLLTKDKSQAPMWAKSTPPGAVGPA